MSLLMPILLVAQVPDGGRSTRLGDHPGDLRVVRICAWPGSSRRESRTCSSSCSGLFVYIFFGLAASVQIRSGDLSSTTTRTSTPGMDWPTVLFLLGSPAGFRDRPATGAQVATRLRGCSCREPGRINQEGCLDPADPRLHVMNVYFCTSQSGIASFFQDRYCPSGRPGHRISRTRRPRRSIGALGLDSRCSLRPAPLSICGSERRGRGTVRQVRSAGADRGALSVCCWWSIRSAAPGSPLGRSCSRWFATWGYSGHPTRVRLSLSGIIVAFLFLFPILDAFRDHVRSAVARNRVLRRVCGQCRLRRGVAGRQYAVLHLPPRESPGGDRLLGVLFFWVPRSIWPNKPIDTGILLANFRGYSFTNLSSPLWAEFAINVGVVCTLLLMIGFGAGVVVLDLRLPRAFAVGGTAAIIGAILPAYMIILLRGSLLQASGGLFVMIASMAFLGALLQEGMGGRHSLRTARVQVGERS